jgi:hypothetical protein
MRRCGAPRGIRSGRGLRLTTPARPGGGRSCPRRADPFQRHSCRFPARPPVGQQAAQDADQWHHPSALGALRFDDRAGRVVDTSLNADQASLEINVAPAQTPQLAQSQPGIECAAPQRAVGRSRQRRNQSCSLFRRRDPVARRGCRGQLKAAGRVCPRVTHQQRAAPDHAEWRDRITDRAGSQPLPTEAAD